MMPTWHISSLGSSEIGSSMVFHHWCDCTKFTYHVWEYAVGWHFLASQFRNMFAAMAYNRVNDHILETVQTISQWQNPFDISTISYFNIKPEICEHFHGISLRDAPYVGFLFRYCKKGRYLEDLEFKWEFRVSLSKIKTWIQVAYVQKCEGREVSLKG